MIAFFAKIKTLFKSLDPKWVIGLAGVFGLLLIVNVITNHIEKKKELEYKIKNTEMLLESLKSANSKTAQADSLNKIADDYLNKIKQNEKVDWSDLYTADPDSIARAISNWKRQERRH